MHEKAYSTWYCFGSCARQSICRSPGMLPAAWTTTASGPIELVERAEDLGLRRERLVVEVEGLVDDAVPPVLVLGVALHVGVVDPVALEARR